MNQIEKGRLAGQLAAEISELQVFLDGLDRCQKLEIRYNRPSNTCDGQFHAATAKNFIAIRQSLKEAVIARIKEIGIGLNDLVGV